MENPNDNNDNSHSHYRTTGTRRIPSWLNAIPSEAGGGSDATSRTGPSVASHRHHHHPQGPPPPYSFGQPEKSSFPAATQDQSMSPPKMKIRGHFNPPNQQLYSETSLASSGPQQQQQHQFQTPTASTQPTQPSSQQLLSLSRPESPSPSKPSPVMDPLRQEVTTNFTSHCPVCISSSSSSSTGQCNRCQMIKSYVHQPYHTYHFLSSFLLPISEVFNYEEMLAHLNETIIERVMKGGKAEKVYPLMDDFGVVVEKARRRKEFLGRGRNGRVIGQWGMVRDGTPVKREEEGGGGGGGGGQGSKGGRGRGGGVRRGRIVMCV
ncbi:hypothetical protein QC764_306320 [Podospora pseudoanserina]|uniref:Uncharacterized protein n=1 Tax=Podospora pseudoanserina TaxID=2609844 RepID=A0ABR0ID62_9PEZI|nr:hypothetical protein QC764_306320 [Podospora pseudoanserina]